MHPDRFCTTTLTRRIREIDPTGPILETASALPALFREAAAALGPDEATARFGAALEAALTRA